MATNYLPEKDQKELKLRNWQKFVAAFCTGYLLGWPERSTRLAMGYMDGARNASIALMIASQVFSDQPKVILMIILVVILMLLTLLPSSYLFRIKDAHPK